MVSANASGMSAVNTLARLVKCRQEIGKWEDEIACYSDPRKQVKKRERKLRIRREKIATLRKEEQDLLKSYVEQVTQACKSTHSVPNNVVPDLKKTGSEVNKEHSEQVQGLTATLNERGGRVNQLGHHQHATRQRTAALVHYPESLALSSEL